MKRKAITFLLVCFMGLLTIATVTAAAQPPTTSGTTTSGTITTKSEVKPRESIEGLPDVPGNQGQPSAQG